MSGRRAGTGGDRAAGVEFADARSPQFQRIADDSQRSLAGNAGLGRGTGQHSVLGDHRRDDLMSDSLPTRLYRHALHVVRRLRALAMPGGTLALESSAYDVVVAATAWTVNGVNVFSANLVRGLCRSGQMAHVLLTEQATRLVKTNEAYLPRPTDVTFHALPVTDADGWGAHWGAMVRWLEESAPCVYIPNSDWRHSCVCPLLSDQVVVVGVVHSDDPLHYDHVQRLGRYWNVIVAVSNTVAQRTAELCPELAERIVTIPIGVRIPPKRPARKRRIDALRVIYHGILKQHQKRVLDLPAIVQQALDLGVPVTLSIAGAGPDEAELRNACAALVERGAIRFLGVVSPDDIGPLLERHDAYLLPSEFEGMPNALIEAMGRGCVPVVSRTASGISELIRDGDNGFMTAIGDCSAVAKCLQALWNDPRRREYMSIRAFATVAAGGFRVEDMIAAYRRVFEQAWERVRTGAFVRPRGPLSPPPPAVAGISLLPIRLPHVDTDLGAFPSQADAEDYRIQVAGAIAGLRGTRRTARDSMLSQVVLDGIPVFVAAPAWTCNGVNRWSEDLVRGLRRAGLDARILLTEEATDLINIQAPRLARPTDIPFEALSLTGSDNWGARWGAMIRTLEAAAPCIYVPTYDWRHSCVVPMLSDRVKVIGTVHDDGPMYIDHAARLSGYWNALVATSHQIASSVRQQLPGIESRLTIIPPGLDFPAQRIERQQLNGSVSIIVIGTDLPPAGGALLVRWILAIARALPTSRIVVVDPPASCRDELCALDVELLFDPNRQQWLALCRNGDFVVAGHWSVDVRRMWFESIGNGCVPLFFDVAAANESLIEDGFSGIVLGDFDSEIAAGRLRELIDNPTLHRQMAIRAHDRICNIETLTDAVIDAYLALFKRLMLGPEFNAFQRTPAPILPPPASVAGESIFPVDLPEATAFGPFPSADDARRFLEESGLSLDSGDKH